MYIPKIRRMVDAIQEIKSIDPETALTHRYIRTMVEKKKITTIKLKVMYLYLNYLEQIKVI